jgi:hypothetical protein
VIENIEDRLYRKIKAFIYVTLPKRSTEIAAYFWQSQSFFLTIATEEEGSAGGGPADGTITGQDQ